MNVVPRALLFVASVASAVLGGAAACTDAPDERIVASSARPIIDGVFTEGEPAVVGLSAPGGLYCTGTLVAPAVVVSAGHCLEGDPPRQVYFGSDPQEGGIAVNVLAAATHPDYHPRKLTHDVSVVFLAENAPDGVTPIPPLTRAPVAGEMARFVGFGCTAYNCANSGDYGRKYVVSKPITSVDEEDMTFRYGIATCNGDSGGPAFVNVDGHDELAGVTSWGDDACEVFGIDTRIDGHRSWIERAVAEGPPPAECGAEGTCRTDCLNRDPDCVTPLGQACVTDLECGEANVCDGVCKEQCGFGYKTCAEGLDCTALEDDLASVCVPTVVPEKPEEGGCRAAPAGAASPSRNPFGAILTMLSLGALLVPALRRRLRRRNLPRR